MPDPTFRAVILTALPVEYNAVRAHLSDVVEIVHPELTVYERGRFQNWEVAIAEIGMGSETAAMEVERAIQHFKPSVAMFVGVAGGVKDVKLGDVVAATKVYNYESGKAEEQFKPRPEVRNVAYAMEQRARAETKRNDWWRRIRQRERRRPRVHVGPIATGAKVIASTLSDAYQLIYASYSDTLAVEMEGFGFLRAADANRAVNALIVRGISDTLDEKEKADSAGWQEIASRHAAAFAFGVLAKFQPEPTSETQGESSARPASRFTVPFPNNAEHFFGREQDLQSLHQALQKNTVGVRPAMLSGLGGIGKTQLAVQYTYAYRDSYPGGVYWVNAAQDWLSELAALAQRVGLRADDASESERDLRLAGGLMDFLNEHPEALIVFDNVEDPRRLRMPVAGFVPTELKCRLIFTTRRRNPALPFAQFEIRELAETSALQLLLDSSTRRNLLIRLSGNDDLEMKAAKSICRSLGYLPLALALAAKYLGKYASVTLMDYLKRLKEEGGLATVDDVGVDELDLPTRHAAAVRATLQTQWDALQDDDARLVLQAASVLGEAIRLPRARLELLTGLSDKARAGRVAPLEKALIALYELSLIEELNRDELQLHPLVGEFAAATIQLPEWFREQCAGRVADTLSDLAQLNGEIARRGADTVLADLRAAHPLSYSADRGPAARIYLLIRVLDLEAHYLRNWNPAAEPGFFLQQFSNRCRELGFEELRNRADVQLSRMHLPYLRERFRAGTRSRELFRILEGFRIIEEHHVNLSRAIVTRDGKYIVSASTDKTLQIWDFDTGRLVRTLEGHTDRINGLNITYDSRLVVTASKDRSIRIWDIETGRFIGEFIGHTDDVENVITTMDAKLVISASADSTIKVWDIESSQLVRTLEGHRFSVRTVALTDDNRLLSASSDGTLIVWNLSNGQIVKSFEGYKDWINSVAITILDNTTLAIIGSYDKTIKIWNIDTGDQLRTLQGHLGGVTSIVVLSDPNRVVSASEDATIKIWDLKSGEILRTLKGHQFGVTDVSATHNGRFIVSSSVDATVKIWDLTFEPDIRPFYGHAARVLDVALTPDGQKVVSASADKTLKVWNIENGQVINTLEGHMDEVNGVAITPDGRFVVSVSADRTLMIWNIETGRIEKTLSGHADQINAVAITPDGRYAISASSDRTIKLWDLTDGQCAGTLKRHTNEVTSLTIMSSGQFLVSGSKDMTLRIWDLAARRARKTLKQHSGRIQGLAVSRNEQMILSASSDGTIGVWDRSTGQSTSQLGENNGAVNSVVLGLEDQYVISVSGFETVKVRSLTSPIELTLRLDAAPLCCKITPDNRTIVVGDALGAVHFIEWVKSDSS